MRKYQIGQLIPLDDMIIHIISELGVDSYSELNYLVKMFNVSRETYEFTILTPLDIQFMEVEYEIK